MVRRALVLLPPRPGGLLHSEELDPLVHIGGITLIQRALYSLQRAGIDRGAVVSYEEQPAVERRISQDPRCRAFSWISLDQPLTGKTRELLDEVLADPFVIQDVSWIVDRQALSNLLQDRAESGPAGPSVITLVEQEPGQGTSATGLPPIALLTGPSCPEIARAIEEKTPPAALGRRIRAQPDKEVRFLGEPILIRAERKEDRLRAERLLLQGLIKPTESLMSRLFERRVSLGITRRLLYSRITPNQISLGSILLGISSSIFFLPDKVLWHVLGSLMLLLSSIIDGCDGELARLRFQESKLGSWLDFLGDNLVHMSVFFCIGLGLYLRGQGLVYLFLGILAALATLSAVSAVFLRVFRKGSGVISFSTPVRLEEMSLATGRLRRQIDFADKISNRDFIYGILILAALNQLWLWPWLSGVGATFYFFYLLYLYRRMRLLNGPRG